MQDALAANITQEQGKTLADAKGDVFRGLGELESQRALSLQHVQCCCHETLSPNVSCL